jgi:ACS family hexuronate transporter-like MFS transporter
VNRAPGHLVIPHLRWTVGGLLLLSTMLNYLDRLTLPVLVSGVRAELHLSETDYAHVVSLFLVSYAIMYAGSGYILDRLGTRRGFAVFMLGWSVAQMLHALAVGKWSLALCRFLLGATQPGNFPGAVKAVREWFPPRQRALGVGLFNAGSSLGSAVASPLAAFVALRWGWRAAFVVTGAAGLAWLVAWLALYQPPARNPRLGEREARALGAAGLSMEIEPVGARPSWRKLLWERPCLTFILARFFTDPVIYFVIFWLPAYLQKERGFDLAMIGRYGWVPYVFGGIGFVLGGWLSGQLIRAGRPLPRARKIGLAVGACIMPAAILAPFAPSAGLALAATCVVVFGHSVWVANLQTLPADIYSGGEVATVSGLSGMGGSIGGVIANLGTGYIVSHFSYAPVFACAGMMHPLALVLVYALLRDRDFVRRLRAPKLATGL